ncbi:MAG TPA: OB-fold domain-containing protein [Sphingobium sp.]
MAYGQGGAIAAQSGVLPSNREFGFFWEGLAEGQLLIQVCDECGLWRCPPGPACERCSSLSWSLCAPCGEGVVHSFAVHHHPPIPPYQLPHLVVLADMKEGFRLMAHLADVAPAAVKVGQAVRVEIGTFEHPFAMFRFRAGEDASS